jgi:hypothetical protein
VDYSFWRLTVADKSYWQHDAQLLNLALSEAILSLRGDENAIRLRQSVCVFLRTSDAVENNRPASQNRLSFEPNTQRGH